jgi:hypothetical protein
MADTVRRISPIDVEKGDTVRLYTAFNFDAIVTAVERGSGSVRLVLDGSQTVDLDPASATDYVWLVAR